MKAQYLIPKSPVETCPGEFLLQNGVCVGELTADSCHPIRAKLEPTPVPCATPYCNAFYDKLCEQADVLVAIRNNLNLPSASGVTQVGCVKEGEGKDVVVAGVVLAIEMEDGAMRYVMKPTDGGPVVDPYNGPFSTDCATQQPIWIDTGCIVTSPVDHPQCDEPVWYCPQTPGDIYYFDTQTNQYELIDTMASTFSIGKPSAGQTGLTCDTIEQPIECVNETDAPITVTCQDLIDKAVAGAAASNPPIVFNSGNAPTGAAPQVTTQIDICVLCVDQPIKLDDGSEFEPTCDRLGVCIDPTGNPIGLSCAGTTTIGEGDPEDPVDPAECADIEILPGAGLTATVTLAECVDKAGDVVDPTA